MTEKNSLLEGLYTDSGGFDAERAAGVLKALLTIQRGTHTVFFKKGSSLKEACSGQECMHCEQPGRIRESDLRNAIHRFSRNRSTFSLSLHEA